MNVERLNNLVDKTVVGTLLFTVSAVPVVFPASQPDLIFNEFKSFLLHLGALVVTIALVLKSAIRLHKSSNSIAWTMSWIVEARKNPALVITFGVVFLLIAQSISSAFSPLPRISYFGVNENYSGFNLYDSIATFILFVGAVLHFRDESRLRLLIYALVVTGTVVSVYGLAQHFGWDDLGNRQNQARIVSSFGNTLNFAGFLVVTIPATLALAVLHRRVGISTFFVISAALGLQLCALWLTGGRGPYIGAVFGLSALIASIAVSRETGKIRLLSYVLVASAVIAIVIAAIPTMNSFDSIARVRSIGGEFNALTGEKVSEGQGGLNARQEIWRTALSLSVNPEVPQNESQVKTAFRRLYGVGPEMFSYSYPLRVSPRSNIVVQINAHNLPLHILATTGLLGFSALLIVLAGLALMIRSTFMALRVRDSENHSRTVVTAIFLSLIFGKIIELQTGVPRISDLTPTVLVLGALVASYSWTPRSSQQGIEPALADRSGGETLTLDWILMTLTVIMVAIMLTGFIGWDVRRLTASSIIAGAPEQDTATQLFERKAKAQEMAPDRQTLTFDVSATIFKVAGTPDSERSPEQELSLVLRARDLLLDFEQMDPYHLNTQLALAKIATTLVVRGNSEFSAEVHERYAKIAEYYPAFPTLIGTASTAMASVGDFEFAIELANRAILTESQTHGWSKAWYSRGLSRINLGFTDEGISDLITATEKQPESEGARMSHLALAELYRHLGDIESAAFHDLKATQ